MATKTDTIRVKRLAGAVGAEICGSDLSNPMSDEAFDTIHHAFLEHCVLVFRNQQLSPGQLVEFSKKFGAMERHILSDFSLAEHPDVFLISNVKSKGKPIGAIRAGQYWHTDCSYMQRPTKASLLHSLQVPSYGGDTMFTSTIKAYEELSPLMQDFLGGLKAVHDYTNAYETFFSKVADRPPLSAADKAKAPPVEHPVVRTHPETGRKAIYVNPGFTRRIVDMTEKESRSLLNLLFEHVAQPHFIYRHTWASGDLVMWDNRSTWHLAIADYDMNERRHFHRTSLAGDEPS